MNFIPVIAVLVTSSALAGGAFAQAPATGAPSIKLAAPAAVMKELTKEDVVKEAVARFDAMDTDRNGRLSPQERRAYSDMMREKVLQAAKLRTQASGAAPLPASPPEAPRTAAPR